MIGNSTWLQEEFLPRPNESFKVSFQLAKKIGDKVEFLKRKYILVENGILVTPSAKNVNDVIEKFIKWNGGRRPRISKTPHCASLFQENSNPVMLDDEHSGYFRSLVGSLLYISLDRWDISFTIKTLASFLKSPTKSSWIALTKVIGYLLAVPQLSLLLRNSSPGSTIFETMTDAKNEKALTKVEVHTDSDWRGSFGKSTSCAIHYVNGCAIHFTSRSQKVVSLSSTESEWYAACSGVADSLFITYCCEFLTQREVTLSLRLDNNGARFLAFKAGSGRIKQMRGKYLWLQELVENSVLKVEKISTTTNTSDLGTKQLSRNRMMALMYIIGFIDEAMNPHGEKEYQEMMMNEWNKQRIKEVCLIVSHEHDNDRRNFGSQVSSTTMRTSSVQLAKRILAITAMASLMQFGTAMRIGYVDQHHDSALKLVLYLLCGIWLVGSWLHVNTIVQFAIIEGEVEKLNVWKIMIGLFTVFMFGNCFCNYVTAELEYMIQQIKNYMFMNIVEHMIRQIKNCTFMNTVVYMIQIIGVKHWHGMPLRC